MPTRSSTTSRTTDDYLADALRDDPVFRADWYASVLARTFGLAVFKHRTDRGLSQAALGRTLGIPQSQVARIEDGEHTPSLPTMLKVCDALGLELSLDIGPKSDAQRPLPKAPRGGIADATDQVVVSVRDAR